MNRYKFWEDIRKQPNMYKMTLLRNLSAVLLILATNRKQPEFPKITECLNKLWNIHPKEKLVLPLKFMFTELL